MPDLALTLTEAGLGEALTDLLYKHGMIPDGKMLTSFVFPVGFDKDRVLPLVVWLQDQEEDVEQLELPLEAGAKKVLH